MKKFITFEEFAAAKAKKTQVQLEQELSTKRDAAANSFKELLSEFGVASIGELSEEDRLKFNEKLGTLTESVLLLEGTRSQVGKIDKNGKITSVYVHYDGYPRHMVPMIKNYDKKGVDQLVKLGKSGISFLDKKIGKKQDFNNPVKGTTLFYGRDRGENSDMTTTWSNAADVKGYFKEVANDAGAEYVYLYDERDGKWYMGDTYGSPTLQVVESVVTEGKNDFMARYGSANINLKKGYKHHTEEELNDLYDKLGDLVKTLRVKDVTLVFESEVNEGAINSDYKYIYKKIIQKYPDVIGNFDLIKSFVDDEIDNIKITDAKDILNKFEEYRKRKFKGVVGKLIGRDVKESVNEGVRIVLVDPDTNKQLKTVMFSGPNRDADKEVEKLNGKLTSSQKQKGLYWTITTYESVVNEGKFKKDDLVYNKRTKTVGIVRLSDDRYGEVKTDVDGNVNVDELEKYNPIKFKHQTKAKVAPSTEKEVNKRGLFNPFKNESIINEAEIKSDTDFKEYAFTVLQKAFGDDFDEAKAEEVVDGILGKVDGDYGKAAGILQSSLG